ncbi:uncharacterized protein LOC129601490 [Paramacrobiotus metropolitanus]|uniref:uncharacterized protein LOC129601490 n=1 Tax=Paramacrobiotus metropolitanus TaxID=2943436 RepID=UPI002445B03D|nr:uncharacterized protein LOC129601490 [Paramacrobiotus metropolitanus]
MKTQIFRYILAAVLFHSTVAIADEDEDIAITEDAFDAPLNISDANAIAGTGPRLWPNPKAIPYNISWTYNDTERQVILKVLRTMERMTKRCILFQPRTFESDYLTFESGNSIGCSSDLGRTSGRQAIYLGNPSYQSQHFLPTCFDPINIQLEVMLALGFDFEQKRPDRDQYVEVRNASISSAFQSYFAVNPSMYTFGTKYDYHSVLHLSGFAAANVFPPKPGMISKNGLVISMGRRKRLAAGDVAKIMIAYKCPLNITRGSNQSDTSSDFPIFSSEPMTEEKCGVQFNSDCSSDVSTIENCTYRIDFRIVCRSNASVTVLQRMAVAMAEPPLRLVSINVEEQLIANYSFSPLQRQVVKLQLHNCSTERVTSRLSDLNFTNLLDFQLNGCRNLSVKKEDFTVSKRLRVVVFYNTTINVMQLGSFTDIPDLQILSVEARLDDRRNYSFDQSFRSFLQNLHCSCEFAWYRSWWRKTKTLLLRTEIGEVYTFESMFQSLENAKYTKKDLYHPIDCHADPFPVGPEWVNYSQIEYSVNEPGCNGTVF